MEGTKFYNAKYSCAGIVTEVQTKNGYWLTWHPAKQFYRYYSEAKIKGMRVDNLRFEHADGTEAYPLQSIQALDKGAALLSPFAPTIFSGKPRPMERENAQDVFQANADAMQRHLTKAKKSGKVITLYFEGSI